MQAAEQSVVLETRLPDAKLFSRGKVRDVYEAGHDRLLVVATDRISAFDVVMAEGVPDKGRVLTQLSRFWFELLKGVVPNHFLTAEVKEFPPRFAPHAAQLMQRSMLVKKAKPFPIECVVRGYLAGSGWTEYQATGSICGIRLRRDLPEADKLYRPIFTPATKAQHGHDENISWEETVTRIGRSAAEQLRDTSLALYERAQAYAEKRGILIADTKFEFGLDEEGKVILIDEALTPDSSRFWPRDGYEPGRPQPSFDKQFVRDYLESVHWNKQPPPPALPAEVVARTSEKYREAYLRLTGQALD